ncbi:MAG TPA: hypothetical protein P5309_04845, partial [Syntrophomonadaceae bacterium]|nr:hypothetical protein [Syntrophomonadaceae bacterium]
RGIVVLYSVKLLFNNMILAIVRKNNYMSHYAYIIESFGLGQARLDCLFLAGFHTILADSKEMVGI